MYWTTRIRVMVTLNWEIMELQEDVVYLSWPIAPLVYEPKMSPNAGWGAGSQPMRTSVHIMWKGTQINFGDLTPYLTYVRNPLFVRISNHETSKKSTVFKFTKLFELNLHGKGGWEGGIGHYKVHLNQEVSLKYFLARSAKVTRQRHSSSADSN
jgi:hypothetical protein